MTRKQKTLAWHFLSDDSRIGNTGELSPPDGEWLEESGPPIPNRRGLHASSSILDALQYAPGAVICRVELGGEIARGNDKLCATRRKILWRFDATEVLRAFARKCALDVAHLWGTPDDDWHYLHTGAAVSRASRASRVAADGAASAAAARSAERAEAWRTTQDAVQKKQNKRLTRMILAARRKESKK